MIRVHDIGQEEVLTPNNIRHHRLQANARLHKCH
jgi:hypothetical protein